MKKIDLLVDNYMNILSEPYFNQNFNQKYYRTFLGKNRVGVLVDLPNPSLNKRLEDASESLFDKSLIGEGSEKHLIVQLQLVLQKLDKLKIKYTDDLMQFLSSKNEGFLFQVTYDTLCAKIKFIENLYGKLFSAMIEINEALIHKKTQIVTTKPEKKREKVYLRVSIYELACICVTLKSIKLLPGLLGRKISPDFIHFIESSFLCLNKEKKRFVPIEDFKSTYYMVTREVNINRNKKIRRKQSELLINAYETVGEHIEKYFNTLITDLND